jgi:hypothetical protein
MTVSEVMKPEETKTLADFHKAILADAHERQEQPAQTEHGDETCEWFRPKMRKAAQELYPETQRRAIEPKGTVITVGEGRGFVVEHRGEHLVVTASHCLPWLPSGFGIAYSEEHVYRNMLGALGSVPTVACECLFINPIADVAVLGVPDTQTYSDEADGYRALLQYAIPFRIIDAPEKARGFVLSVEGEWFGCQVEWMERIDGPLWVSKPAQPIEAGMSGSPIASETGNAIGIVAASVMENEKDAATDEFGASNPRLMRDLPLWLLRTQTMRKQ